MSLEGDPTKLDWLEEIALFLQGQDTWAEPAHLAIARTDLLLCPCGLQLSPRQLSDLTPGHKKGRRQPLWTGSAWIEGQVPDYPALCHFQLP